MSNKERWQKLAGIIPTDTDSIKEADKEKLTASLKEGFTNFGMVQPGVLGNPFEGRMSQVVMEQEMELAEENFEDAGADDLLISRDELNNLLSTIESIAEKVRNCESNSGDPYGPHVDNDKDLILSELDDVKEILLKTLGEWQ